jgi:intracellular sulfur oxidation DsrE/DsrF family protein
MQRVNRFLGPLMALFIGVAGWSYGVVAQAGDSMEAAHKVVIQVSSDDPRTQTIALNNAVNFQKAFGMDNVDVQIVAYGPGLSMLTAKSKNADRVKSLAMQNVGFNACGNTMRKIERKTGKKPQLVDGVKVADEGGVARILELQEKGYGYIRP